MSSESFHRSRGELPPDEDFVIFDPAVDGGVRRLTADEEAGLRDAIRVQSERLERGFEGPDAPSARELVERAEELHIQMHIGDATEAAAAREELFALDAMAAARAGDLAPETVEQRTAEYVALMVEDASPTVENEARARRLDLEHDLEPEPDPPAQAAPDLDEVERAYIESRGLDRPDVIRSALKPEQAVPTPDLDDEERER